MVGKIEQRSTTNLLSSSVDFCTLISASAVAWVFCIELIWLVFYTFRRWSGLYFYAILVSSLGCALHAVGWTLKYLTPTPNALFLVIVEIGWVSMVSGQSVVLYSRLHLVLRRRRLLRLVLAMIIIDGICMHGPTIVLTIGTNTHVDDPRWKSRLGIMERIQLPVFCIQEFIISTIYIVSTIAVLRSTSHSRTRTVMRLLITVNAICLSMDAVLIGLEYANDYVAETSIKALLYATKLKLEFAVLNQLMNLAHNGLTEGNRWGAAGEDPSSNPYHPPEPPNRNIYADIDTGEFKTSNLTGWPRGRLFGDHSGKKFVSRKKPTSNSQVSQTQEVPIPSEPSSSHIGHLNG